MRLMRPRFSATEAGQPEPAGAPPEATGADRHSPDDSAQPDDSAPTATDDSGASEEDRGENESQDEESPAATNGAEPSAEDGDGDVAKEEPSVETELRTARLRDLDQEIRKRDGELRLTRVSKRREPRTPVPDEADQEQPDRGGAASTETVAAPSEAVPEEALAPTDTQARIYSLAGRIESIEMAVRESQRRGWEEARAGRDLFGGRLERVLDERIEAREQGFARAARRSRRANRSTERGRDSASGSTLSARTEKRLGERSRRGTRTRASASARGAGSTTQESKHRTTSASASASRRWARRLTSIERIETLGTETNKRLRASNVKSTSVSPRWA